MILKVLGHDIVQLSFYLKPLFLGSSRPSRPYPKPQQSRAICSLNTKPNHNNLSVLAPLGWNIILKENSLPSPTRLEKCMEMNLKNPRNEKKKIREFPKKSSDKMCLKILILKSQLAENRKILSLCQWILSLHRVYLYFIYFIILYFYKINFEKSPSFHFIKSQRS